MSKRPVMSIRLNREVKDDLRSKADELKKSLSAYAEMVLTNHCKGDEQCINNELLERIKSADSYIDQQESLIEELNEKNKELRQRLEATHNQATQQNDWEQERQQLKELVSQQRQKIQSLESLPPTTPSQPIAHPQPTLNGRLSEHINILKGYFPKYSTEQLIALSVACAARNQGNWVVVYTLDNFMSKYPDFLTSKAQSNDS